MIARTPVLAALIALGLGASASPSAFAGASEPRAVERIEWQWGDQITRSVDGDNARLWALWDDGSLEKAVLHGLAPQKPLTVRVIGKDGGLVRLETLAALGSAASSGKRIKRLDDLDKPPSPGWVIETRAAGEAVAPCVSTAALARPLRIVWTFSDGTKRVVDGEDAQAWLCWDQGDLTVAAGHGFGDHPRVTMRTTIRGVEQPAVSMTGEEATLSWRRRRR